MMLWMPVALAAPNPALVEDLTARHAEKDCATLEADYGLEALVEVAEQVPMPPWVPMRAASCVGAASDRGGQEALLRWLADASLPGLAAAAVAGLAEGADLAPELVVAVASRASADARFARAARLQAHPHPVLRALKP